MNDSQQRIILMHSLITNGDVDLSVAIVADEALAASIEERFRVLWLRPCFEYLLVVEDDGTIRRR